MGQIIDTKVKITQTLFIVLSRTKICGRSPNFQICIPKMSGRCILDYIVVLKSKMKTDHVSHSSIIQYAI